MIHVRDSASHVKRKKDLGVQGGVVWRGLG